MRSALTPQIFRRLLRNEPIVHQECLYRRAYYSRHHHRPVVHQQRRTLFGWISPLPKEALANTGDQASLIYLKDACSRLDNRIRAPPSDQLAKAWTAFIRARKAQNLALSDVEAKYAVRVFIALRETEHKNFSQFIPFEALGDTLRLLQVGLDAIKGDDAKWALSALSMAVFEEINARLERDPSLMTLGKSQKEHLTVYEELWLSHCRLLSKTQRINEVRDLLVSSTVGREASQYGWQALLVAFRSGAGTMGELSQVPTLMKQKLHTVPPPLCFELGLTFGVRGDLATAKESIVLTDEKGKLAHTHHIQIQELLDTCRKSGDLEWGREIIKIVTTDLNYLKKSQSHWNALFTWALGTGKSVDEVNRMMEVMVRTKAEFRPTNATINSLIKIANEKNDPYLAERLVSMGEKWGVKPDVETFLLQMDYRLSIDDVEGARTAFDYVRSFPDSTSDDSPRINRLIQTMCGKKKVYSFDAVMSVVDFLGERRGRFEPATVAALSTLHLKRDEYNDVADLLSTNVSKFSLSERAIVRAAFVELMLDPDTPIRRLWDTYMIFQRVFPEAPRASRIAIMDEFFKRDRSDMAVHVFNHMRRSSSPDINPDADTYIAALAGCGRTSDRESLAVIHNVLKLDLSIDPSTALNNAKMLAFLGTGEVERAQLVWEDIIQSPEGPSLQSVLLIFRVCENSDFGEMRARNVWELLRSMDAEIDGRVVAAYVGALAGNGCVDEARGVVERSEAELGVRVDELILAKLFNGVTTSVQQHAVEEWINDNYPQLWTRAEKLGFRHKLNNTSELRLDVPLSP